MALPTPEPGLVIHYGFLWGHEHDRGRDEARYPRPCAIVVGRRTSAQGEIEVLVTPFTHRPPSAGQRAVQLPPPVQAALGLPKRTWAIVEELNIFAWPGFDLARNPAGDFAWGRVPPAFREALRLGVLAAARDGVLKRTLR